MDNTDDKYCVDTTGDEPDECEIKNGSETISNNDSITEIKINKCTKSTKSLEFNVDTDGIAEEESAHDESISLLDVIPSYDTSFTGFLTDPEFSLETGKRILNDNNRARPKKQCFNCLGDHGISECKKPFNPKKIAENKKKILGARAISNIRYHEDPENKYGSIQAGKLSQNLRDALGLDDSQLPEHIYRMRMLGYPPGWLREAEVHRSAVALFGGDGKAIHHPDDEDGEVPNLVKYKPEKLIRYPGFNCDARSHIIDESNYYRSCSIQPCHRIEEFRKYMNKNKSQGYKRKRLKLGDSTPHDVSTDDTTEMDISVEQIAADKSIEEIVDLQTTDSSTVNSLPNETTEIKEPIEKDSNSLEEPDESTTSSITEVEDSDIGGPVKKSKTYHRRSKSLGSHLGAHLPETISTCTKLPDPDLWTVDVHDHLLFENLPDSTGTWDQMKGIMDKVKSKMKVIHMPT